jgi:hypothetical protein
LLLFLLARKQQTHKKKIPEVKQSMQVVQKEMKDRQGVQVERSMEKEEYLPQEHLQTTLNPSESGLHPSCHPPPIPPHYPSEPHPYPSTSKASTRSFQIHPT